MNPPYTFGDRTFHTKDSVRQYFLNRLIGMEPGDKASEEDSAILRGLLKLHTNRRDYGLFSDERATFGVGTTGRGRTPKAFFIESGRFRAQVSVQGCLYEGVAERNPFPAYVLTVADVAAAYPTPAAEEIFIKRCETCNSYQDAHLEEILEVTRDQRDEAQGQRDRALKRVDGAMTRVYELEAILDKERDQRDEVGAKTKLLIEDNNTLYAATKKLSGLHTELRAKCDALGLEWAQKEEELRSEIFHAKISLDEACDERDDALRALEVAETYAGWAKVAVEDRDELARKVKELESGPNDYEAIRERLAGLTKGKENTGQENRRLLVRIDELQLEIAAVRYSAKMYKKGAESEIHRYNTQLEEAEKGRGSSVEIGGLQSENLILNDTVDRLVAEIVELKKALAGVTEDYADIANENVRLVGKVNSNSVTFNRELNFLRNQLTNANVELVAERAGLSGLVRDLREEIGFIYAHGVRKSLGIPSFSDAIKLAKNRLTGR